MRIYGSNIKKNYNKNNKHHKKIFKFLLISFSILVLLGNSPNILLHIIHNRRK